MAAEATIAILGGSSAFVPALAAELAAVARRLPSLGVRLMGRDMDRLQAVARACRQVADPRHQYVCTTSVEEAAAGADVVINQMRIGGFAGRTHDERFPLAFDLPGDETIGPGGLASAFRSVPVVLSTARRVAAVAPDCWFVNLTNPMGILVRALQDVPGVRSFGLCELPAATLDQALGLIGRQRHEVQVDYMGLNHQGWFVRITADGEDLLPAIFARLEAAGSYPVAVDAMRRWHALPLPYLRLYEHRDREVALQRQRPRSRGEELEQLSRALYADFAAGRAEPGTRGRDLPWLRMAVVPTLLALLADEAHEVYATEPNGSTYSDLRADAVVEKRCRIDAGGPRAFPLSARPAPRFAEFLARIAEFEQLAWQAALHSDREQVARALRAHPFAIEPAAVAGLVPHVVAAIP